MPTVLNAMFSAAKMWFYKKPLKYPAAFLDYYINLC